ncbi:DUF2218 domain-containing protein [Streptomyces sp. NPDC001260]|uniref:DUF2218 domain-containing protein n=1 Tax=Streptomyces sp. NPDC001260 TaxID=3364551 RepID=UPI003678EEC9
MPTAEARIATDRASRYLVQLCRHTSVMRRMRHQAPAAHGGRQMPEVQHVDWSDTHGWVRFAEGQWTLDATSDALTLRVEADDGEALQRLRTGITGRLEKIGRRDRLTVTWQDRPPSPGPPSGLTQAPGVEKWWRRRPARTTGVLAVGVLVVALHLSVAGAAMTASSWTRWAANGVLALIVAKVVFMAGHVVVGRTGIRRGKALWDHRRPRHMSPQSTITNQSEVARVQAGLVTNEERT